ncbi:hypothetical protein LPJ53_004533 [Coemansia erecta]|uniref:Uncharacterized protein n=1 Tax=Coemansia erecta TaxID=147472 RepID=A0A9W7XYV5_9FUNG|nr:hypothetical protein LPJ53_004533 [Coemansia erecta]
MSSHIPLPKEKHSQTKLYVTLSSLTSKKREDRRCIETHPFNYRCTILTSTPLQKQTVLKHIGGYYRVKLKPSDLISPDFINGYVKPDTIVALSLESRIDTGDVIAIDGQGTLILSLCKDTYEELGIVGSKAQFPLDDGSRHIVRIDLKAGVMDPSKKYYQRIKWRFDEVLDREMDFLLGRFDCKTGAALNFDMPGAMQCSPAVEEHVLRDIWVPGVDELFDESAKRPSDVWTERVSDIFEWIGVAASGTDGAQRLLSAKTTPAMAAATSDICTYSVDEPRSMSAA